MKYYRIRGFWDYIMIFLYLEVGTWYFPLHANIPEEIQDG